MQLLDMVQKFLNHSQQLSLEPTESAFPGVSHEEQLCIVAPMCPIEKVTMGGAPLFNVEIAGQLND